MRRLIVPALAVSVLAASAMAGCAEQNGPHDRTNVAGLRNADAYNEAVRRCGVARVRQAEGAAGVSPSDYICTGP
jgi:hypothetical protein